ncbi:MAG: SIS domain-containing protein, partial [Mariprofundaceae bacterium]|nr:SIS domain-containing protein [Mariprofundaceae bacterium]
MKKMIRTALEEGITLRQSCLGVLDDDLMAAAQLMVKSLQHQGKVLACGNGGSASDAQHFVAELVNRFEINRPALGAIAMVNDASVITSIANDFSFDSIYARQTEALGREGDVLLAISTSGAFSEERGAEVENIAFSFEGPFGTYDRAQLQRGLQVYTEVCSACHGLRYVPLRTLGDLGYTDAEVRAYA